MKTSEAFMLAKAKLPYNRRAGVCFAIDDCNFGNELEDKLKAIITSRIQPFAYASTWLGFMMVATTAEKQEFKNGSYRVAPHTYNSATEWHLQQTTESIQVWRHHWLDSLICEFQRKGD